MVRTSYLERLENGALIIGGHTQGLGLARMLGKYGIPIILIDTSTFSLTRYSKYCLKFLKAPNQLYKSNMDFSQYLISLCKKYLLFDYIIFPTDDQTIAFLSKNKEHLSDYYTIWTQEWDIIRVCYNKRFTYEKAKEIGLYFPKSFFPVNESDLKNIPSSIKFPVILKPAIMQKYYKKTKTKVIVVKNERELIFNYKKMVKIINPSEIIIQEIIPGSSKNLFSLGSFFKYNDIVAGFVGKRSRQLPMDFGKISTYVEIEEQPEIMKNGTKLLRGLKYYGISEVEFKFDSRDQKFKLLEINPRTWKWHSIGLIAGINLPLLLYCDLKKCNLGKETLHQKKIIDENLKWIDIYSDAFVVLKDILKKKISLTQYFDSIRGKKVFGSLTREDPLPFIIETILLPYFVYSR
ncbi:MAG: carboxylate--amine ligase [Candidatus Hodarchaeales archaeon]